MKKKEYMTPELEAIDLKITSILCASADMSDNTGDPVGKDPNPNYDEFD